MIKVHDLKPAKGSTKAKRRVGRGIAGKGGKTAGRGTKGQHARNTVARGFEGGQTPLHRKDCESQQDRNRNQPDEVFLKRVHHLKTLCRLLSTVVLNSNPVH